MREWTVLTYSYFATYELLKKKLSPVAPTIPGTGEKAAAPPLSIGAVMLAGGTAGVAMWSVAIPPDVSLASQASHLEEMTRSVGSK
jgi:hypothetical protein